jgi:hypothetical protein
MTESGMQYWHRTEHVIGPEIVNFGRVSGSSKTTQIGVGLSLEDPTSHQWLKFDQNPGRSHCLEGQTGPNWGRIPGRVGLSIGVLVYSDVTGT